MSDLVYELGLFLLFGENQVKSNPARCLVCDCPIEQNRKSRVGAGSIEILCKKCHIEQLWSEWFRAEREMEKQKGMRKEASDE